MAASKAISYNSTGMKDAIVIEDATKYGLTLESSTLSGWDFEVQVQLQKDGEWYGANDTHDNGNVMQQERTRADENSTKLRTYTLVKKLPCPVYAARVLLVRIPASGVLRFELLKDDE